MRLRAARNAGLYVPKETVDACIHYVKRSQNPDGGFRYMLQGGASAFPRSAAGVVALQRAGEYDTKEVRDGIAYLRQYIREIKLGNRYSHYFYGHYYAAQAMWLGAETDWAEWYPGDPRRADPAPVAVGLLVRHASAMSTARRWRSSSCRFPTTICRSFSASDRDFAGDRAAIDRALRPDSMRTGIGTRGRRMSFRCPWLALFIGLARSCRLRHGVRAQEVDRAKTRRGFGESRRGDVPEGTLEMMTPETDKAIKNGLAWLARNQNADGSSAAATYRGNIAVTSLAGLAFMASGSSPGRGPLRSADRQGAGLRDGQHLAVGLHRGGGIVDARSDVFARVRHVVSGRSVRDDASAGDPREAAKGGAADHRLARISKGAGGISRCGATRTCR